MGSESWTWGFAKMTCPLGIPSGASRSYWNPTPKTALFSVFKAQTQRRRVMMCYRKRSIRGEPGDVAFGRARSDVGRDAGFLGSDSNIHAKHPQGTPEGGWILAKPQVQESDPNKPGDTGRPSALESAVIGAVIGVRVQNPPPFGCPLRVLRMDIGIRPQKTGIAPNIRPCSTESHITLNRGFLQQLTQT